MGLRVCIDIGNTRTKVGEFLNGDLKRVHVLSNEEVIKNSMMLDEMEIEALIVSSVNTEVSSHLDLNNKNYSTLQLDHATPLPIRMKYETPETLGKDRIALAVAAHKIHSDEPTLVIDAGTCITYDFVDAEGTYYGGAISPGVQMRLKAMHFGTSSLPLINWQKEMKGIPELNGKSTISSMLSGVVNGAKGEMEAFIVKYSENRPNLKVLLTGGDAEFFEKELKNGIFADPNLLLKGLNEILDYNLHL